MGATKAKRSTYSASATVEVTIGLTFETLQNWDVMYEVSKNEIKSLRKKLEEHDLTTCVDFMGFSDAIIISLPVTIHPKCYRDLTKSDDYWWMINIIGEALIPLLRAISRNIALRGAVSVGRFFFGPAVKDAACYIIVTIEF